MKTMQQCLEDKAKQNKNGVSSGTESLRTFWRENKIGKTIARNARDKSSSSQDSFQRNSKYNVN